MRKAFMDELLREKLGYGCLLGTILFVVTILYVSLQKDTAFMLFLMPYSLFLLAGYLIAGILFILVYKRQPNPNKDGIWKYWFKGASAGYWMGNFFGGIFVCVLLLSEYPHLRNILLLDTMVLTVFVLTDYHSLSAIAKELNQNRIRKQVLLIDLDECPRGAEAFCREIEEYCKRERRELVFVKREKPAEIFMDGERYVVELESFYHQFGPMYALKFICDKKSDAHAQVQ